MRDAACICFHDGSHFRVGQNIGHTKDSPLVSRITVADDLPGLDTRMERARVWVGDQVFLEAPVHMLESIEYPLADP